jgi:hypothetical protein
MMTPGPDRTTVGWNRPVISCAPGMVQHAAREYGFSCYGEVGIEVKMDTPVSKECCQREMRVVSYQLSIVGIMPIDDGPIMAG